ncbi:hypothetical protein HDU86_002800 [Geranomyces michiganensis]|nr:hypothetical protein HDU86_002800 [Geranomyces michiganensis]
MLIKDGLAPLKKRKDRPDESEDIDEASESEVEWSEGDHEPAERDEETEAVADDESDDETVILAEPEEEGHLLKMNQGPTIAMLQRRYVIPEFESESDLRFLANDGLTYNLSKWVRAGQRYVVRQIGKMTGSEWTESHICDMLLMHNVILFSPKYVPKVCECRETAGFWNLITSRRGISEPKDGQLALVSRKPLRSVVVGGVYLSTKLRDLQEVLCEELKDCPNLKNTSINPCSNVDTLIWQTSRQTKSVEEFGAVLIVKPFYDSIIKIDRLSRFGAGVPDADTKVHATLHTLMEEIFKDDALVMRCSKAHRATYRTASGCAVIVKAADGMPDVTTGATVRRYYIPAQTVPVRR